MSSFRWIFRLAALSAAGFNACLAMDDFGDHPGFAHAMEVRTQRIDDMPVLFQYGRVRPEFSPGETTPQRRRAVLGKGWRFRFDPKNEGDGAAWHGTAEAAGDWTPVTVPHCWDMMPGGRFYDWSDTSPANPPHYNGAAWYRLSWDHQPVPDKRYRLEFLGVQQRARVFLNGREIALHEGGGQPFSIDATPHLRSGVNVLAVKVIRRANHRDAKAGESGEPAEIEQVHGPHPKAPDNWPYAGITREVALIEENPATVSKTLLRTMDGMLEAAVILSNAGSRPGTFSVRLESPALENPVEPATIEVAPGGVRVLRFKSRLRRDAEPWSPARPTLHPIHVMLGENGQPVDAWKGSFGIRSIAAQGAKLVLNGSPVFLKGVAMYEETRTRGAALLPEDHAWLFRLCRGASANFIRLQVSQRSPVVYQMADRQGFMLTGEWGGFWYKQAAMAAQTEDPLSIYQSHARCAVWDLMNHPSVVLWCTSNESHQFCEEYGRFVAKGTEIIRELDWQNRPVSWAAWHPHKGQPEFQHADVVGFNEYRGAMDPFEDLEPDMQRVTRENPGKPLVIMENGAWSSPGKRGRPDQRGTEDWQADLLKRQHAVLSRHIPPLSGYTYWILTDYRSRKHYTAKKDADGYSAMGLYGPEGEVKQVRDVFRDLSWPLPKD